MKVNSNRQKASWVALQLNEGKKENEKMNGNGKWRQRRKNRYCTNLQGALASESFKEKSAEERL